MSGISIGDRVKFTSGHEDMEGRVLGIVSAWAVVMWKKGDVFMGTPECTQLDHLVSLGTDHS